jgi:hypothetical protein
VLDQCSPAFTARTNIRTNLFIKVLPFPDTVTHTFDPAEDSGMNYLNPVEEISFAKRRSTHGVQAEDLFDIHTVVANRTKPRNSRTAISSFCPPGTFLKRVAREAIFSEFKKMGDD